MNERSDPTSPWGTRLYYPEDEFEFLAEEQLDRAGGVPFESGRGVDVDAVLLRSQGLEADFVDLPDGVLGRTRFGRDGTCAIELSRGLSLRAEADAVQRRRFRTTLAHEYGHVVCHRTLFLERPLGPSLFEGNFRARPDQILCRGENIARAGNERSYRGEWWEYQASRFMSSILLPRQLFLEHVSAALAREGLRDVGEAGGSGARERVLRSVAAAFDVNPIVVDLRIQQLGWGPRNRNQSTLAFG